MRQVLILSLVLMFLPVGVAASGDTPYGKLSIPFTVERVPGTQVYYVVGQSGVPGTNNEGMTSNAGFVITARGVVVYDALGTPALGYRLLQEIRHRTQKPVRFVVVGHYHADHVYGLRAFREHTKAEVWAHEQSADYLNGPEAQARLDQRREALWPWMDEQTVLVRPDKTYRDQHHFDMGDTRIDLYYVGPGHAPDDTIMVVREAGVVFSGDLIFGGRLPFLADESARSENWLKALKRLQDLKPAPRVIVPGHGKVSTDAAQVIAYTKTYIEYLREHIGKAGAELIPFDEAYARTDWSRYRNEPTFDEANRRNAYQVYLEMQTAGF